MSMRRREKVASFDILLRTRTSLHADGEPTDFISAYSGIITCTDDETGKVTKVGRVAALKVHAGLALDAGESLFDVCDAHSHELHSIHTILYQSDGYGFRKKWVRKFDAMESDFLLLDYVVLSPKWRKLKLGLLAVRKLVDLIGGGCGLAVSLIAPLRADAHKILGVPESWLTKFETKEQQREARVKLRRYFRQMGFARLGKTPYYALPLNQVTPDAAELLGQE
jgi:hypothetical protein